MPFLTPLQVSLMPDSDTTWRVDEPLVFQSEAAQRTFTVPAGSVTDFASVPRIPPFYDLTGDTAHEAAVLHDWLYTTHAVDRKTADRVFLEAMQATGVPWWRRTMMYAAVRVFGASHYDPQQPTPETRDVGN